MRVLSPWLGLSLCVGLLAACGSDDDPTPPSPDVADDVGTDAEPDAPEADAPGDTVSDPDGDDTGEPGDGGDEEVTPDVVPDVDDVGPDADPDEMEGSDDCENLLETNCLLPFPSDYFLLQEGGERRLRFYEASLPVNNRRNRMTDTYFSELDGWGIASPILLVWPGASLEGTAPIFQPGASLEPDSLTVILDTNTGERLPHWVEIDWLSDPADDPVIVLRPAVPLAHDTRYIVALRDFVDEAGAPMEPPRAFRALRDGEDTVVRGIDGRRDHFDTAIFPALAEHGIERSTVQLAWDFTTATREDSTWMMRGMRERLLEAIGEDGPDYVIDTVEAVSDPAIDWMATGRIFVPSFLLPADPVTGLRRVRIGEDGMPAAEGFEEVEFTLQIPASASLREGPLGVLMYGHGFIGTKGQANGGWLRTQADEYDFLILALDMQGMTDGSMEVWIGNLLRDATTMPIFTEEVMQGIMNHVAALRMMRTAFLTEDDERLTNDGAPLYDPDRLWYYGNSQGGTLGTLIMATTPDVENGVLGVPGCSFPLLLQRSTVFTSFTRLLSTIYRDPVNVSLTLGLLGTAFNRIDGLVWQHHIEQEPLPGATPHRVLLHVAKEDGQVHNEISFLLGRALGAPILVPTPPRPYDVWGLVEQPYPWTGSAVTEFDFGIPDQVDLRLPAPEETDTHGWLRRLPEGRAQMMHFLETGEVLNFCDGYCLHDGRPD